MMICFVFINIEGYTQSEANGVTIGHSLKIESKILEESRLIEVYLPQTYGNNLYQ